MKGVLICGGSGSRLRPLTEIINKSLLPVYDRPLILYPLQVMLDAGIKEIAVVSGTEHIDQMSQFLGGGSRFRCRFEYCVQEKPQGIAQALGLAESFADGQSVCAMLGDNVFFDDLSPMITSFKSGAHLFLKKVSDPERFGVATIKQTRNQKPETRNLVITSVEEKPTTPKTDLAVTGCYVYDKRCFDVIRGMKPSSRGELEITDVSRWYIEQGRSQAPMLEKEWIDAGTFESLFGAAELVRGKRGKRKEERGK